MRNKIPNNFFRIAALLFALQACGEATKPGPVPASAEVHKSVLTEADAMQAMFGHFSPQQRSATWLAPAKFFSLSLNENQENATTKVLISDTSKPGRVAFLLATRPAEGSFDCHPCGPIISVAVFEQKDARWTLAEYTSLGEMGGYGQPPAATLRRLSPEINVFVLTSSDLHMGIAGTYVRFIGPTAGGFATVFATGTKFSNEGACEEEERNCAENSTSIIVKPGRNYPVIVTQTKGTENNDLATPSKPVDSIRTWHFDGNEYK